jgi:hypothetical protein
VSIDIYQAILEHAPSGTYTAAGNLHEAIWTDLLRRSDPRVHNVRVTRGDGGLDGVGFQDPVTGDARVYQAKFFQDLSDDKDAHKKAVVDAFVRAHCHPFSCSSWVLLFPRQLSHTELGWLMGALKTEAISFAATFKGAHAQVQQRIQGCAIEYRDATDLVDLLTSHLDIAAKHLPKSHLALSAELQKEREGRAHDRAELARNLQVLSDEAIRTHQADARRAKAALSILNQGWANLTGTLQLALVDQRLTKTQIQEVAGLIEAHATSRAVHAYSCEGLAPGISELVAEINYQARVLKQVTVMKDLGLADVEGEAVVAKRVLDKIQELQRRIGDVVMATFLK